MKKLFSFILSISMLLGIFGALTVSAATDLPFADIKASAWYYDEVKTVYEEGIMEGKTADSFAPKANMTRAEFVTVLCRMSGDSYEGKGTSLFFADTKANAWYADYVAWGVETDMVKGLPDNKFAPNKPVTRQEMAVFIERFVSYMDATLPNNSTADSFADAGKIADFAKDAVELMRRSGVITGDEKGYFKPKANATRAEVATVLTRILPILDSSTESGTTEEAPYTYTVYLPDNYSENESYPLVIYVTVSNKGGERILFENTESPVHNSIIVVPDFKTKEWGDSESDRFAEFMDFLNSKYSTDSNRQYIIAVEGGGHFAWQFMTKYPKKISAAIFVQAAVVRFWNTAEGYIPFEEDINEQMKDMPIYIVHDTTEMISLYPEYGRWVYDGLRKEGYTNVYLKETTGYYDDIINNFVSKDDVTLLNWLFAQRRETK